MLIYIVSILACACASSPFRNPDRGPQPTVHSIIGMVQGSTLPLARKSQKTKRISQPVRFTSGIPNMLEIVTNGLGADSSIADDVHLRHLSQCQSGRLCCPHD